MLPTKKLLKLSRNQGHKLAKSDAPLDDSLDDFLVTRPLRTERKTTKDKNESVSKCVGQQQIKLNTNKIDLSASESELVKTEESKVRFQCPQCNETLSGASEKSEPCSFCVHSALSSGRGVLFGDQHEQLSEPLSPRPSDKQLKRRMPAEKRSVRRKAADPSDLSLAIALSESLQSANENARKLEEELLITGNMTEVIAELRNDEQQATGTVLSHVLSMPAIVPTLTKVKRKAKAATKREPAHYILSLRSHAERERLIADRAASVLNQEPDDPVKPPKAVFTHPRPISEYIQKFSEDKRSLWQRSSLQNVPTSDQSNVFYVDALRSVISPSEKKCGYSNILLHVSQLPGRNSSQGESIPNTQMILEELASAAEGGFIDDPSPTHNGSDSSALPTAFAKLKDDWSQLVNNPLMSDVTVWAKNGNISAHRLVFAARFPSMLDSIITKGKNASERFILDWSSYSASSALRVLHFIYTACYEHNEDDVLHVRRIARRHNISDLIDLLPHQHESDHETSDEEEEDSVKLDTSSNANSVASKETCLDRLSESSTIQNSLRFSSANENEKKETLVNKSEHSPCGFGSKSLALSEDGLQTIHSDDEELSILQQIAGPASEAGKNTKNSPTKEVKTVLLSSEHHQVERTLTSALDMEMSSNVTSRIVPLSPDMFHQTLVHSDEEPNSSDEVVDLTQETDSDRQSNRSSSPHANSCEKNSNSLDKTDVSMAECSLTFAPSKSSVQNPKNSSLQNSLLDDLVGSCSRANPSSFINDSVSSWSCYGGEVEDVLHNYPSPMVASMPSPCVKVAEVQAQKSNNQYDEFPDELDSIFGQLHDVEPSPKRTAVSLAIPCSADGVAVDVNTPEGPRQAKKRKMDVTPLPDYQSMETPLLKQELVKYGLKPLKRSNAVKLLHHIYEELHPLVTDSESSFQDTPERQTTRESQRTHQPACVLPSPSKSIRDSTSCDESGHSQEDEESMIVMELDREIPDSQLGSPVRSVPLKDRMKTFFKKRPDIHKLVLTYEPISFEYLFAEIRKERIRCKAQELLDWLDEECITCRMKSRNRNHATNGEDEPLATKFSPAKKVATAPTRPAQKARRGVVKKLL
ncbi:uncharacterized protein LOC130697377 [Daphnia carinata]|uniref:uncharacterized protein LOC130697377 n=1 Tax=Daphnia carinata TaxID=120202 RepID=UPI00257A2838|nr:uncharacterized protein LOC130697377 [Daphnia carinata]XP_057376261.1 uncharacterized protein LOC130697377 [Daphnia carinata]